MIVCCHPYLQGSSGRLVHAGGLPSMGVVPSHRKLKSEAFKTKPKPETDGPESNLLRTRKSRCRVPMPYKRPSNTYKPPSSLRQVLQRESPRPARPPPPQKKKKNKKHKAEIPQTTLLTLNPKPKPYLNTNKRTPGLH